jgi:hypothetical protein
MLFFENQILKDKIIFLPKELVKKLSQILVNNDNYTQNKGYKRLNHLINGDYNIRKDKTQTKPCITYSELKRIKNFFDNFKGNDNDIEYILNGGTTMKNWTNSTLDKLRNSVEDELNKKKQDSREFNKATQIAKEPTKPIMVDNNSNKIYVRENKIFYINESQEKIIKNKLN